jgi:hydrocephalus-inducing protein
MPDLQISNDAVEFTEVRCGECKIITVQLNNHKEVRCDWFASYLPKKDEKFTPLHLKRKKKLDGEVNKPRIFEIMPPTGILMPGQKANIQIKFMPTEEVRIIFIDVVVILLFGLKNYICFVEEIV